MGLDRGRSRWRVSRHQSRYRGSPAAAAAAPTAQRLPRSRPSSSAWLLPAWNPDSRFALNAGDIDQDKFTATGID